MTDAQIWYGIEKVALDDWNVACDVIASDMETLQNVIMETCGWPIDELIANGHKTVRFKVERIND